MRTSLSVRLLVFLLSFLALAACSKSDDKPIEPEKPAPGAISGHINAAMAGSVVAVAAVDDKGHSYSVALSQLIPPYSLTNYTIPDVVPGTYDLRFSAAPGWREPVSQKVIVASGATTQVGTITPAKLNKLRGIVTWTEGNQNFVATSFASGGWFGASSSGDMIDFVAESVPDRLVGRINLNMLFRNPGQYRLGGRGPYSTLGGDAIYTDLTGVSFSTNRDLNSPYIGTCTITSWDAVARSMSGTFSFNSLSDSPNPVATVVSNGTFNISF